MDAAAGPQSCQGYVPLSWPSHDLCYVLSHSSFQEPATSVNSICAQSLMALDAVMQVCSVIPDKLLLQLIKTWLSSKCWVSH